MLDDSNDLWRRAVRYSEDRVFYFGGEIWDADIEIGPDGIFRTNGSMEFPWQFPAGRRGLNGAELYSVDVTFDKIGWKETVRSPSSMDRGKSPVWSYGVGSCFFEVHKMHGSIIEVRQRIKVSPDEWEHQVFRPVLDWTELKELGRLAGVEVGYKTVSTVVEDKLHPYQAFDPVKCSLVDDGLSDEQYCKLISNVKGLRSSLGIVWGNSGEVDRLWKEEPLHIPRALGCVVCHRDCGKGVSVFQPFRDWYGVIRGGDGIFSFDPYDHNFVRRSTYVDRAVGRVVFRK